MSGHQEEVVAEITASDYLPTGAEKKEPAAGAEELKKKGVFPLPVKKPRGHRRSSNYHEKTREKTSTTNKGSIGPGGVGKQKLEGPHRAFRERVAVL